MDSGRHRESENNQGAKIKKVFQIAYWSWTALGGLNALDLKLKTDQDKNCCFLGSVKSKQKQKPIKDIYQGQFRQAPGVCAEREVYEGLQKCLKGKDENGLIIAGLDIGKLSYDFCKISLILHFHL